MTLDTFVTIVCAVITIVSWGAYRYFSENVYLTYKDQTMKGN